MLGFASTLGVMYASYIAFHRTILKINVECTVSQVATNNLQGPVYCVCAIYAKTGL